MGNPGSAVPQYVESPGLWIEPVPFIARWILTIRPPGKNLFRLLKMSLSVDYNFSP